MNNDMKYYLIFVVFFGLACSAVYSQTIYDNYYPNPDDEVRAIAQQSDGRLIIGGYFDKRGVSDCFRIGRLYVDGTLDSSFNASADDGVRTIAIQPDGKIIVGGDFEHLNGTDRLYIGRLESNGDLDAGFNPAGAEDYVRAITIQSDGKILVGGYFTTLAGQASKYIGRLNADGSFDSSFTAQADGVGGMVRKIVVQPDGRIIIAGLFDTVNGETRNNIARLNADGTLDTSFNPNVSDMVWELLRQDDGKIIIAGYFTEVGGTVLNHIARLNADGSVDTSFDAGIGAALDVYCGILQTDGKILLGGAFDEFNDVAHHHAVRLNADGSVDATFDIGAGFNDVVYSLYQQADGKIAAGGAFDSCSGRIYHHFLRLYSSEGKLDSSGYLSTAPDAAIYAAAVQRNDRMLIGGNFTTADGVAHKRIARVGPCYDYVDASFTTSVDDNQVRVIVIQPDDKIIIGGNFTTVNGEPHVYIARLLSDGTIDPDFTPGVIFGGGVRGMALQTDGKVVIGGGFTTIDGASYKGIARLNTNGVIDASFNPGDGVGDDYINSVTLQPDGKILVGGMFTSLGGQAINRIGRLNADGSVDLSFNPDADDEVMCITVQPDGKILAGGLFHSVGGAENESNHIVRLDTNGNVDASFNLPDGTDLSVRSIALHCDGKIIISGGFTTAGGEPRKRIARLNSDGSLDTSFDVTQDADDYIYAAMIQKDGKIICGGIFDNWGGIKYQARVATINAAVQLLSVSGMGDAITWLRSGASPELTRCIFEYSFDNATWSELGAGTRISGGWQLSGLTLPPNTNFYVRATGLYCGSYCSAGGSILDSTRLVYLTTPRVVITNISGVITGYYGAANYTLSGTNNINVTGTMWWTNSLGGSSSFAATTPWSVTVTGLIVGTNTITVYGSNVVGDIGSDSVTFVLRYSAADPAMVSASGGWYLWLASMGYQINGPFNFGVSAFPVTADFDADGKADPTMVDGALWYIWFTRTGYQLSGGPWNFGVAGIPVAADFDGDSKADPAMVIGPLWYIWFSGTGYQLSGGPWNFGVAGIPVAADFDGDDKGDPGIVVDGLWYIWFSGAGYQLCGGPWNFGVAGIPVAADFDSDGKADPAMVIYNLWYIWFSGTGYQLSGGPWNFGVIGYPVAADFDGR